MMCKILKNRTQCNISGVSMNNNRFKEQAEAIHHEGNFSHNNYFNNIDKIIRYQFFLLLQ